MKLFDKNAEIESIEIKYTNGKSYYIGAPKNINLILKLIVDEEEGEDAEELYSSKKLQCEVNLFCTALWDNVNLLEE